MVAFSWLGACLYLVGEYFLEQLCLCVLSENVQEWTKVQKENGEGAKVQGVI